MTPLEFISDADDLAGNSPMSVLFKEITIASNGHMWQVLSYYYDPENGCMCLDIEKIKK